jgi:hypothetical protein
MLVAKTMMQEFIYWLSKNGHYLSLMSVAVLVYRWRHLDKKLRTLAWFIGVANLGEIVAAITAHYLHINNLYLFHIYTVIEFNVIAFFYGRVFGGFVPRWLMPVLMISFTVFAIINSLYIQVVTGIHTYTLVLECLLVIGMALLTYYQTLAEMQTTQLEMSPIFWVNTGFLLYFAGVLFVFMLRNASITESNQTLINAATYIHLIVLILLHVFISIGLWLSPKRLST